MPEKQYRSVILIGPPKAGKSILGKLLAERLSLPQASLDEARWKYYADQGYNAELARRLRQEQGFGAVERYWRQFNTHAVLCFLADHPSGILDFGGGNAAIDDPVELNKVKQALAPYPNVFLLMPEPDPQASIRILLERLAKEVHIDDKIEVMERLVHHPAHFLLARSVIYTSGKTPEQTCEEVVCQITEETDGFPTA